MRNELVVWLMKLVKCWVWGKSKWI